MNSSNGKTINMKQQTLKSLSTAFALGAILLLGACQQESGSPTAPAASTSARAHRFHLREPGYDSAGTARIPDLADFQRH